MASLTWEDFMMRDLMNVIPELKGLTAEDYEAEKLPISCSACGENDYGWKYRIHGEKEWKEWIPDEPCRECRVGENNEAYGQFWIKQEKLKNDRFMNRYSFIPVVLEKAGFKTYERTNNTTINAVNTCIEYVSNFKNSKPEDRYNLLLMGNPGTGKSHLSVAIYRTLKEAGFLVGFITTEKLLALIKETYNKWSEKSQNGILEDLKKFDLLVLDDLGAEQGNKDEFSWTRKTLFEIVDSRLGKPMIYTTNFNDSNIAEAVGERIASRLYVKTKFIDLFTDDYRKKLRVM